MPPSMNERHRLEELSAQLREATYEALLKRSALARALDESRCELERPLMLTAVEANEYRRVTVRAQMMLDAWKGLAAGWIASSR